MTLRCVAALLISAVGSGSLAAQDLVPIATDGILGLVLAPGQVTTLTVTGLPADLLPFSGPWPFFDASCFCFRATSFPLPTAMAGISIELRQYTNVDWAPVPILAAYLAGNGVGEVIIQAPYSLKFCCDNIADPNYANQIRVSANGAHGRVVGFKFKFDRIHVVNYCDPAFERSIPGLSSIYTSGFCRPVVNHADGTPVGAAVVGGPGVTIIGSQDPSAQPGEILTIYAYGLGYTSPVVTAGAAAPNPPALSDVILTFNFSANAAPSFPGPESPWLVYAKPEFSGLVPGYAGLYQVNFKVPTPPPGTPACLTQGPYSYAISNVTLNLYGGDSFDGAGFCVQVPPPATPRAEAGKVVADPDRILPQAIPAKGPAALEPELQLILKGPDGLYRHARFASQDNAGRNYQVAIPLKTALGLKIASTVADAFDQNGKKAHDKDETPIQPAHRRISTR